MMHPCSRFPDAGPDRFPESAAMVAARRLCAGLLPVLLLLLALPEVLPEASAVDRQDLRRRQLDQQRARAMAQKLVATAIAQQLHQLEDNGLTDLPVYGEIRSMQQNIGALVEHEMAAVVDMLAEARQLTSPEERDAKFVQARSAIRGIVLKLAVERQKLLKRLKTAEIAEQVQRLIRLEGETLTTTKRLPEEARTRREQMTVQTIEDQRDIRELFLHLVETLADVSEWGGPLGDGAVRGLRLLKTADVGDHLDRAGRELEAARYAAAAVEQATVIAGLRTLLDEIRRTQGVLSSDNQSLIEAIERLAEQQKLLRGRVQQADLADLAQANDLIGRQTAIQDALQELAGRLPDDARAQAHLDSAIESAGQAGEQIFSSEKDAAQDSQRAVEGQLAALKEHLQQGDGQDLQNRTAEELAGIVRDLEQQKAELQRAAAGQDAAREALETRPAEAAQLAKDVSEQLTAIDSAAEERALPETVAAQLDEAVRAARAVAELPVADAQPDDAGARRDAHDALASATVALDRVRASTEEALAEARRIEAAVRIGELARAAEALERAAAAERQIAEAARRARQAAVPLAAETPQRIRQQQQDVDDVVRNLAQGVQVTSPDTAESLRETLTGNRPLGAAVDRLVLAAEQEAIAAAARQTAADSGDRKRAAESGQVVERAREQRQQAAAQVAPRAEAAANELAAAAKSLRREIAAAAETLAGMTRTQLARVDAAQESVDGAVVAAKQSVSERLRQLNAARGKVADATSLQYRAAGRPEAAASLELARAIRRATGLQAMADRAAAELASGKAATPLQAATAQQGVADAAQQLAQQAGARAQADRARQNGRTDELAAALQQARQAASEAARQTLDGNAAAADAARQQAGAALQTAASLAQAEVAEARQTDPTDAPDAAAQSGVVSAARAARQLAGDEAAAASESLQTAVAAADDAAARLGENRAERAGESQRRAGAALAEADQQLAAAMRELAGQEAGHLAAVTDRTRTAARTAAEVDASAAAALRAAQKRSEEARQAAMEAAQPAAPDSGTTAAQPLRDSDLRSALDRAAADLAAKAQQLNREQALAQAIAELALSQQKSVDELAAARDAVEAAVAQAAAEQADGTGMSKTQQQAAQRLGRAMQQFAQAQRLTGEGAVELSGQEEVANQPIRQALEMASGLLRSLQPADPQARTDALAAAGQQPASPDTDTPNAAQPADGANGKPSDESPPGQLAQAQSADPGDASQSGQSPGQPTGESSATSQSATSQSGTGQSGQQPGQPAGESSESSTAGGQPSDLGTGFVPNSPETTARMMAGPELLSELSAMMQAQLEEAMREARDAAPGESLAASDAQQPGSEPPQSRSQNQKTQPGQIAPAVASGAAQAGEFTENDPTKDGPLNRVDTGDSTGDSQTPNSRNTNRRIDGRRFRQSAWFARLPPELRRAIQASSRRRAPRAYEERLRRYFESLE